MTLPNADFFDAGKYGAGFAFNYYVGNAVTNQTNTDLALPVSSDTLLVMPQDGSVVAVTVQATAEVTAGAVTFKAHKDGTEFTQTGAPAPVLNTTNTQQTNATVRPSVLTFSQGEGLGVSYSSTTDAAPTNTNDYSATLFVQLDPAVPQ